MSPAAGARRSGSGTVSPLAADDTPDPAASALAARIREAREYIGFTVADAARYLGWSPVLIDGIEDGTVTPDAGRLAALGKLYRRPVEWFRGEFQFEPTPGLQRMLEGVKHPDDREAALDFAEFLQCMKEERDRA